MTMWNDPFTGVRYQMDESWTRKVRRHLAEMLSKHLQSSGGAKEAADKAASFWKEYYGLIFPLRFGKEQDSAGRIQGRPLFDGSEVTLNVDSGRELRTRFLDEMRLPPLLPSQTKPDELVSDHHLTCAAITNVVLRAQGIDENILHQIRLGVLLHELSDQEPLRRWLSSFPMAHRIALFLSGEGKAPEGVEGDLLKAIHDGEETKTLYEKRIYLVAVSVQRVKQFVFETPGLNEIRGASTLLDDCVEKLKNKIGAKLGPEVVFRASASTLEFLAPSDVNPDGERWTKWLRRSFYKHTGAAFPAAAVQEVSASDLLTRFHDAMRELYRKLEQDRYHASPPMTETLPFELRCYLCRTRPAEGWYTTPDNKRAPACRVCFTKRKVGRLERAGKVKEVLDWLGLDDPKPLGVETKLLKECIAPDLDQLIPQKDVEHKRIAVIYGDGNNFGAIVQKLKSLPLSLQWTHRVEKTTKAAVALALARSTREAAEEQPLKKLPFQILSLGGDDLSLFTWGRIGLRFCEQFLLLTDQEFQRGEGERLNDKPISFSLGALFCDAKAPVRRTVDFAENELLKWAKRASHHQQKGNIAFLLATTAEQIPTDLKTYQTTMFVRHGRLCLTLRPFTAKEMGFLLDKALCLRERHKGVIHRLVEPFIQSVPLVAFLHYIYQKEREKGKGAICLVEERREEWEEIFERFPLPAANLKRRPFGEEDAGDRIMWFSPLWDLLEMMKILE